SDGCTDPAIVNQLAAGLQATAEEGIRGAADQHAFFFGSVEDFLTVFTGERQRLLAVNMLASRNRRQINLCMSRRNGQVDDDFNIRVGQQLIERIGLHPIFFRFGLCAAEINIGAGGYIQNIKFGTPLKIAVADIATANDAYVYFIAHRKIFLVHSEGASRCAPAKYKKLNDTM